MYIQWLKITYHAGAMKNYDNDEFDNEYFN